MKFIFDNATAFNIDWVRFRRSRKPTLFQQQNIRPRVMQTAEPRPHNEPRRIS